MKRFTTIALIALLAIATLVAPASALVDVVEVRSEVFNGTDFDDIFTQVGGDIVINTTNFAGFWYDLDDDLSSESISIIDGADVSGIAIDQDGLVYTATIVQADYAGNFDDEAAGSNVDTFPLIGLFADKYVPTSDSDAGELVKLLVDSDDKYTLRTGSALELAGGYELTAKQIDVDGNKVWMELSKDGEFVEDEVIDVSNGEATWNYDLDVGDQTDVIVFRVLITDVFQGQVDSLAVVEGIWLVDYESILSVESSDEFGELEVDSVSDSIVMKNSGTLTLSADKDIELAEGMMIMTADSDDLRFAIVKEYTEEGTYEVRGTVATGTFTWTAADFAGFWYDLDDDIYSETLEATVTGRTIDEADLVYTSTIQQTDYTGDFADEPADSDETTFPIIGIFAQEYVATSDSDAGELVKLLVDSDDKYTLRTGSALELVEGYELTAKQIDVDGNKVWMELSKDGEFIEDEVIDVSNGEATWNYDVDVGDQTDVIVFRVLITDVFQGQVDSLAVVEGIWLIDYENILTIETSDEFGELEVDSVSDSIVMQSSGTITLSADKKIEIAEGIMLKTADDSDNLRYYPYVERVIGAGMVDAGEDVVIGDEEDVVVGDEDVVVGDEDVVVDDETPMEDDEAPVTNETADEPAPGFEAVFAVAGLLAVAYLVRRN
ncbi:S-layer protein domain-containing protein [Methanolobus sp.]|jgi:S-layer protein (TIGR01567 family)|uniref:S-layer protein domain-containing protein n=1 Tax=Methanolobus sp. TaxID=1874737 RepID=UPI0025CF842F|nr:S-layer protein domain-containing protein [Methanolobus sp.]